MANFTVEEIFRCYLPVLKEIAPSLNTSEEAPAYMYAGTMGVSAEDDSDDDSLLAAELHFKFMEEQQAVEEETKRLQADDDSRFAAELQSKFMAEQQAIEEETQRLLFEESAY